MKTLITGLIFWCFTGQILYSQMNSSFSSSSEILQSYKKLNTLGSVLYIAAHPDDENTRLLAYLANEKNYRTGYLSITRGDGGQNLIGKEQGEALGVIRTQELLAARKKDGAEQFFTRANDFGYSKNPEETFVIWNRDSVLADVVFIIRCFKPDAIICRFPSTGEGGHGHHTASALLAMKAFEAAADPGKFPEQLRYTQVWQSKRLFWNTFNFGGTNTTAPDQLKIDVGVYNPLMGKSYGELASESRSMHKSQGFGASKLRGTIYEYFKLLKGDSARTALLDQVNTSWERLSGAEKITARVQEGIRNFQIESPQKSLADLVDIYKMVSAIPEITPEHAYWKKIKLDQLKNLLLATSGLWLEALASDHYSVPGHLITYSVQAINRNSSPVVLKNISFINTPDTTLNVQMNGNELYSFKRTQTLPEHLKYSGPYWLSDQHAAGLYTVRDQQQRILAENEPPVPIRLDIRLLDLDLSIDRALVYKYTDPVRGELYRAFEILPPASINFSERMYVFGDISSKEIGFTVRANAANISGQVELETPVGWTLIGDTASFKMVAKGEEVQFTATLSPQKNAGKGMLKAQALIKNKRYSYSIDRLEYEHIPSQFLLRNASALLLPLDLKKGDTHIAFIPGAGDEVAGCLKQIGYQVTLLQDEQLKQEDLSKYSSIVTGVRAYNTNERLQTFHPALMQYVKNGGNLLVQYNTNSRVGPLQAKIGPHPFTISRNRVTDENASVRFVNDKHPALLSPNKITDDHFKDWIQERGVYFASDFDKNYEPLFLINDPGEKESNGSLIICKYGKGNFIYTGLSFFRQLPAGVSGAYPLFVNLISLKKNKN